MTAIRIASSFAHMASVPEPTERQIKDEPMLFNCDVAHAFVMGGPLTHAFLEQLRVFDGEWLGAPLVIDSRVHMLMPGWYPCIPGWHHDDVPRTRSDGQPNYAPGQRRSEHVMMLLNGDVAPTKFAVGDLEFEEPALGDVVYRTWHTEVERRIAEEELEEHSVYSGELVWFNDRTWHRGSAAVSAGWRFFIRASRYFSPDGRTIPRGNARTNEVRRQVQVYLDQVNEGW